MSLRGWSIAWEGEPRQRGKRDVVRASDACFEHSAAPHGNVRLPRRVVDGNRFRQPAYAANFDVDDPASAQFDRRLRITTVADGFIQTNGGLDLLLQRGVVVKVVPPERLLDHQQD